jgi:hypothetical protein
MNRQVGAQDDDIVELARRETDPAYLDDFQPITRGPIVAIAGLVGLALVVPVHLVWRRIAARLRPRVES